MTIFPQHQAFKILNDFLSKSGARGRDGRDLESGIAWLLWMLGFSVAHLGGTDRTQDAADLIATTPKNSGICEDEVRSTSVITPLTPCRSVR
jgi:hypothetical protein